MADRSRLQRDLLASCWTWSGDVGPGSPAEHSPVPWPERVAALAASGWRGVGLAHADVLALARDVGLERVRRDLAGAGVERIELEMLRGWWADGEERAASDRKRDELLDAAAALGASALKVGARARRPGSPDPEPQRFLADFVALAERASGFGVDVALEAMSNTNLPRLADAVAFVAAAGHPRAGLAVDNLQLLKSGDADPSALPGLLAGVPIFVVEVADAPLDPALRDDPDADRGVGPRRIPGQGDADAAAFIAALWRAGWRGQWGVEIISEDLRGLPLSAGLDAVAAGTRAWLDEAQRLLDA
ncbi:TIM barrel protein [Propioniciclava coleopterorum]|uniref:TIM barrel protein n=1 Tax=Propioniciclava coleopterorum TaxID=2714937 RepID=A0A6G7Y4B3_9ACTN|nr:TIM barrel protein [Propioniciclava coleopterorum]QIK71549.1 TIM barrel protein [Propioniciclava coleopterorum]